MVANQVVLQNEFFQVFDSMNKIYTNGDEYMAINCARVISDYIRSGSVQTVDVGTPSGKYNSPSYIYNGKGDGKLSINESQLKNLLYNTFLTYKNDYDLAMNISHNIHLVCSHMQGTLSTIGSVISSGTIIDSEHGSGSGNFVGNESLLFTRLISCYNTMRHMYSNGDMYHAQELSIAIDNYLKSGTFSASYTLIQWGTPFGNARGVGAWKGN